MSSTADRRSSDRGSAQSALTARSTAGLLVVAEAEPHGQQRHFDPGARSFRSRQPDRALT